MCRAVNLTTFVCRLSWHLGTSTSWNPLGLSRPVQGLIVLPFLPTSLAVLNQVFNESRLMMTSIPCKLSCANTIQQLTYKCNGTPNSDVWCCPNEFSPPFSNEDGYDDDDMCVCVCVNKKYVVFHMILNNAFFIWTKFLFTKH